jgi:hypothetical protein
LRQRLGKKVALQKVDAHRQEHGGFVGAFNAFGDNFDLEGVGKGPNCFDDRTGFFLHVVDERFVDLDRIDRQRSQIRERRKTGAEIVERDTNPHRAERDERRNDLFVIATDVFPEEPVAADDPLRCNEQVLLYAHRAGARIEALHDNGRRTVAGAELILRGLPPVLCRRAQRETVARSRSIPIKRT